MSEERLTRLEEKVDGLRGELQAGHAELRNEMRVGHAELRNEMHAGHAALRNEMQDGHAALRTEMQEGHAELRKEMRAGYDGLRSEVHLEISDLGHQMRVLHEATRVDIRDLAPDLAPVRRGFEEADAKLREDIERLCQSLDFV